MILLKTQNQHSVLRFLKLFRFRISAIRLLLVVVALLVAVLFLADRFVGVIKRNQLNPKTVFANIHQLPANFIQGLSADPEQILIDVKFKHFAKIRQARQLAITRGTLLASSDKFVPAELSFRGRTILAKLRLKGNMDHHWAGDK